MKIGGILREVAGWALILIGLWAFRESWLMLAPGLMTNPDTGQVMLHPDTKQPMRIPPLLFEAPVIAFIGFVVFRGGIHLLKVSVAARITAQAGQQIEVAARRPKLPLPKPALPRR